MSRAAIVAHAQSRLSGGERVAGIARAQSGLPPPPIAQSEPPLPQPSCVTSSIAEPDALPPVDSVSSVANDDQPRIREGDVVFHVTNDTGSDVFIDSCGGACPCIRKINAQPGTYTVSLTGKRVASAAPTESPFVYEGRPDERSGDCNAKATFKLSPGAHVDLKLVCVESSGVHPVASLATYQGSFGLSPAITIDVR